METNSKEEEEELKKNTEHARDTQPIWSNQNKFRIKYRIVSIKY